MNIRFFVRSAACLALALCSHAWAYQLYKTDNCNPGQRWSTSAPVKVRLLADSYFDYLKKRGGTATMADLVRIDSDIRAVVDLYNAVPGSKLVLEMDSGITGNISLREPDQDNYGAQTIVIGFTDQVAAGSSSAEAWAPGNPADGCTRTRAHILFRKDFNWTFGPPDTTDVDGRSFSTAAQPREPGSSAPRTFLGILTHEMGHAVGLGHPLDNYAVMAQSFRTWFRGPNHILRTRLLPDDTAGLLALYGTSNQRIPVDISVSNSWYESAQAQFSNCTAEIQKVNAAVRALSQATGLPITGQFPADTIFKGQHVELFDALESAQAQLQACEDSKNAMQVANCKASSRGDLWTGQLTGANVYCGVNRASGSAYPPVSNQICPGEQVQLRYTLNNHTAAREVLIKSEAWFSLDTTLNVMDGVDLKSPDSHELTLKAASSASIGQMFRMPAQMPKGKPIYVFVRAVPHDPQSGASLLTGEPDAWNNAIMLRSSVQANSQVCP
jgi:Matrixin